VEQKAKWKFDGVRVVHSNELDINTPQTPGMNRAAAITCARTGAEKLWAGTVVIHPKAKTGAHHHGPVESVIYVVSGKALSCMLCRSGQEPVVVNLDIPVVEKLEEVHWVDNIHPAPKK
jgi:uncharacterized RmlC-like cupin family protein